MQSLKEHNEEQRKEALSGDNVVSFFRIHGYLGDRNELLLHLLWRRGEIQDDALDGDGGNIHGY